MKMSEEYVCGDMTGWYITVELADSDEKILEKIRNVRAKCDQQYCNGVQNCQIRDLAKQIEAKKTQT